MLPAVAGPSISGPASAALGSTTLTASPAPDFTVGTQTLSTGGPAITVSDTTLLLDTFELVINGQTTALLQPAPTHSRALLTIGQIIATTLVPGGPAITISGTTLSLASATALVINGQISTLPHPTPAHTSALPPLVYGSSTTTANSASAYVIGTQTLSPGGPAITVSGTLLGLALDGTALVVRTNTVTEGMGLGGYIWSGLGGSGTASGTTTGPAAFTGAADSRRLHGRGKLPVGIGLAGVLGAVGMA
ncbi:hypothetical protein H2201_008016 [Coniosporium apollinis]|uniref:DUF3494 domain-containing protein n=2 Tax=Coniosporium TaxID=2810619 RepID=A0ABQ9NHC1_9PEZI|nr:hypothetical protein H2199_005749 [Cladosporium sp. JES 115]KAJ9657907.1 hypothetical protein H2201_008016 [Coniosporium apollinis]